MGAKRKAVVNTEVDQLAEIEGLIDAGLYRTLSEFVREAVADKLKQVRRQRLAEQVSRYCRAGYADEDLDLIGRQALDGKPRAKR